jgi:hypothetical protein
VSADAAAHRARPWRVHAIASDFELLDLWELPVEADPARGETFGSFLKVFLSTGAASWPVYSLRPRSFGDVMHLMRLGGAAALVAFRELLGRLFALDDDDGTRPIPGRWETRVRSRLTDEDRAHDTGILPPKWAGAFEKVYGFENEALLEIANRTIHALLHLSWVEAPGSRRRVVLAVYAKSRGAGSRFYLALIKPFRHMVVYPAWIGHVLRTWQVRRPAAVEASSLV